MADEARKEALMTRPDGVQGGPHSMDEFRAHAHRLVDWMADYFEGIEHYPVKSTAAPGSILAQLPLHAPTQAEPFESIFDDFQRILLPGITHWQHPSFFAYFPANNSAPSVLAEMLTATLGAQCMSWATSPAAAELEQRVMEWLRELLGLPAGWEGVIQDTASTSTLCALLTARETHSSFGVNRRGFTGSERFTVYCSTEAHSSVEKAVRIAGIGAEHLRKIPVDDQAAMRVDDLEREIRRDLDRGFLPLCVVNALGTTGTTGIDPLAEIGGICRQYRIWLHVDAAYAGSALLLPEYRGLLEGIEQADSFVFNPHKWLFTNFDCSAYFVKDREALMRTFEILPEYLRTTEREPVHNYRDWGIQLGRRFRALKLWFVLRSFGVEGLQERLRFHIHLARHAETTLRSMAGFEVTAPTPFGVVCFRLHPPGTDDPSALDRLNALLMERVNGTGKAYFTHTRFRDRIVLRLSIGQTTVEQRHVDGVLALLQAEAATLIAAGGPR